MEERTFLIHKLGETFSSVDITGIRIKAEVRPDTNFNSWEALCDYFMALGATVEALAYCAKEIENTGSVHLALADPSE
jgi:hypothetical protein